MAKSSSLSKPVSFSLGAVLFFALAFGAVGSYALWKTFAAPGKYSPSLTVVPSVLKAGDSFNVSGCGYDKSYGNVIIGFTGGGWGSPIDANGCISVTGIPALSGDTLPSGAYPVTAYQYIKGNGKKLGKVAETSLTVQ